MSTGEVADLVLLAPDLFDLSPREVKEITWCERELYCMACLAWLGAHGRMSASVTRGPSLRPSRSAIDILLTQSLGKNSFCPDDVHQIGERGEGGAASTVVSRRRCGVRRTRRARPRTVSLVRCPQAASSTTSRRTIASSRISWMPSADARAWPVIVADSSVARAASVEMIRTWWSARTLRAKGSEQREARHACASRPPCRTPEPSGRQQGI